MALCDELVPYTDMTLCDRLLFVLVDYLSPPTNRPMSRFDIEDIGEVGLFVSSQDSDSRCDCFSRERKIFFYSTQSISSKTPP